MFFAMRRLTTTKGTRFLRKWQHHLSNNSRIRGGGFSKRKKRLVPPGLRGMTPTCSKFRQSTPRSLQTFIAPPGAGPIVAHPGPSCPLLAHPGPSCCRPVLENPGSCLNGWLVQAQALRPKTEESRIKPEGSRLNI